MNRWILVKGLLVSLVVSGLLSQAVLKAQTPTGRIRAGKTAYAAKPREEWKDRGRIVGTARSAPAFKVIILDAEGKQVKSVEAGAPKDGVRAYEVEWLGPGAYSMRVTAEGYTPLLVVRLDVRANQDLQLNLEFTK
jgi:hypothetical protein